MSETSLEFGFCRTSCARSRWSIAMRLTPPLLRKSDSSEAAMSRHGLAFGRALNVGSKSVRIADDCVNLDIVDGPGVDVVGDAHALGSYFAPESFDTVVLAAVLQYCERPYTVVEHAAHVLKPGGTLVIDAPFLQPYCRDGDDLWRFTADGLNYLCRKHFDVLEVTTAIPAGPALAFAAEAALRGETPSNISKALAAIGAWALLPLKYVPSGDCHTAGAILLIASKKGDVPVPLGE